MLATVTHSVSFSNSRACQLCMLATVTHSVSFSNSRACQLCMLPTVTSLSLVQQLENKTSLTGSAVHASNSYFTMTHLFSNTVTVHVSNCFFNQWYYDSLVQQRHYRACQQLLPHSVVLRLTRSAALLPCMSATVTSHSGTTTHLFSNLVTVHASNCYFTQRYCDSLVQQLESKAVHASNYCFTQSRSTNSATAHLTTASQDALFQFPFNWPHSAGACRQP